MGSCLSRKLASSSSSSTITRSSTNKSSSSSSKHEKIVRVVHLNGRMEEFEDAITVGEVTGGYDKHFVFAQAQLLSLVDLKPLDSATQLEMGNIYFLLPHSIFQTEMSSIDLATISKRLTLAATQKSSFNSTIMPAPADHGSAGGKKKQKQSKVKRNRYADRYVPPRINNTMSDYNNNINSVVVVKQQQQQLQLDQSPCSWKPILESITERSFTRAESDSLTPR